MAERRLEQIVRDTTENINALGASGGVPMGIPVDAFPPQRTVQEMMREAYSRTAFSTEAPLRPPREVGDGIIKNKPCIGFTGKPGHRKPCKVQALVGHAVCHAHLDDEQELVMYGDRSSIYDGIYEKAKERYVRSAIGRLFIGVVGTSKIRRSGGRPKISSPRASSTVVFLRTTVSS